jgi:hypothetical protein
MRDTNRSALEKLKEFIIVQSTGSNHDTDTIKELTDILIFDGALLSDLSARKRDLCDVDARDFDLVLHVSRANVVNAFEQVNSSDLLLTQEIANLDHVLRTFFDACHVDRKVGITKSHLIFEAFCNASNHVLDM